jgi:hypothetical protein
MHSPESAEVSIGVCCGVRLSDFVMQEYLRKAPSRMEAQVTTRFKKNKVW